MNDNIVLYVLLAIAIAGVLFLVGHALMRLWFAEKEKHLTRVLKKIKEE